MTQKTLREHISEALASKKAVGHFNISNMEGFWAVVDAARTISTEAGREIPVIIGVSEGERDFIGVHEISAVVREYRERTGEPVFLNADHTYSFDRVKEVVDAGYDAVIFDGTELPFDENVSIAKKCVEYARSNAKDRNGNIRDIIIESEIGFIGKSSKVLDALPEGVQIGEEHLTKPEEALRFVTETGVDMLAPAVGNIHGMLKGGKDPALNIKRVVDISTATKVPLVLHGGSGNSVEDVSEAISGGVAVVHINTELRVAYRSGLVQSIQENPDEIAPYKYLKGARKAMQKVAEEKLRLFNKI
jgi:fructose-bisphosphate aldolase, class II